MPTPWQTQFLQPATAHDSPRGETFDRWYRLGALPGSKMAAVATIG